MNEVNPLFEAHVRGPFPVRLMRARAILSGNTDAEGFVRNPLEILRNENIDNPSQALKRLEELKEIKICEQTGGLRPHITLVRVLGIPKPAGEHSETSTPARIDESSTHTASRRIGRVIDESWKHEQTHLGKMQQLLVHYAREQGTYPVVKDPMLVCVYHHFHGASALIQRLEQEGHLSLVWGGGTNGQGISEITILKEEKILDGRTLRKVREREQEEKTPKSPIVQGCSERPVAAMQKRSCGNRVTAFIDGENFLLRAEDQHQRVDFNKILRMLESLGTFVGWHVYVSYQTFCGLEWRIRELLADEVPVVLVEDGENAVDRRIQKDVLSAVTYDQADMFVLGTNDGGSSFQNTVAAITQSGKIFKYLSFGEWSIKLFREQSSMGAFLKVLPEDENKEFFRRQIREWMRCANIHGAESRSRFLRMVGRTIIAELKGRQSGIAGFHELLNVIWFSLPHVYREEFREIDCRYAVSAWINGAHLIYFIKKSVTSGDECKYYSLNHGHQLISALLND